MTRLIRLFCKPFMYKKLPSSIKEKAVEEEVIGLGYHPERFSIPQSALFQELPRIASDLIIDDDKQIREIRSSLATGEYGDGKIFLFPVLDFYEF